MDELNQEQAKAAPLRRKQILEMTLEAHGLAVERGQAAAALRAIELLGGESHGMFKDHTQLDISARMRELSDDELIAMLDRNLALLWLPRLIAEHSGGAGLTLGLAGRRLQDDDPQNP